MEIMNSFIVTGCCSVLNVFGCLLETCDRKYNLRREEASSTWSTQGERHWKPAKRLYGVTNNSNCFQYR